MFLPQNPIKEILNDYDLNIGNVIKRPIDGLLEYHKLQIDISK